MGRSADRRSPAPLLAGAIVAGYGLAALAVARGPGALTTYAGAWPAAAALGAAAGIALGAAGVVAATERPASRLGALALAAGVVWFAPFWVGWEGGPPLVRSLALVAAGFAFPLLVHLVLAAAGAPLRPVERALLAAVYVEAGLSAVGRALFRDPFLDPACWDNCTDNVFLVHASPGLARGIHSVDLWFAAAAAVALAAVCVWRIVSARGPARSVVRPAATAGIALAAVTVARTVALERTPLETPADAVSRAIFAAGCVATGLVAVTVAWAALRPRLRRRSVGRIVADLGDAPRPGALESALRAALSDPALRVAYWLPASKRYADAAGLPVGDPVAEPPRTVTPLVRNGSRVAVVVHAGAVAELEDALGAAVRLALENERLQAEVLAQLADLRASRARIVETGDTERRRLERNLHDGAQQRLLALSYDIRLARAEAERSGDAAAAALLAAATTTAQAALADLRDLAGGIHPAILTQAGLTPALATLADTARLAVELEGPAAERYPAPVESAAYVSVAEALDDAARRGAAHAGVSAARVDGSLVVRVEDDGTARRSPLTAVTDRVGALGGRVVLEPGALRVEIPCA